MIRANILNNLAYSRVFSYLVQHSDASCGDVFKACHLSSKQIAHYYIKQLVRNQYLKVLSKSSATERGRYRLTAKGVKLYSQLLDSIKLL